MIETELMRKLMTVIIDPKCPMVWIDGPPGSGKTTTLYWLYKRCKDLSDCNPVAIPLHSIGDQHYQNMVTEKIKSQPSNLYFFIDISKPREISMDNLRYLERLLTGRINGLQSKLKAKFVVSVSSNFLLYLKTSSACTFLRSLFYSRPVYTAVAFSPTEARQYLTSVISNVPQVDRILEVANNIPRLLSFYCIVKPDALNTFECFTKYVENCIINELDDVFKYISKTNSAILMLPLEAKLLWAVQAKLPFRLFGITPTSVQELWLVKSFLVSVSSEVPVLYLPFSDKQIEYFSMLLCNTYYSNIEKTVNVMNDAFENSIPKVLLPAACYTFAQRCAKKQIKTEAVESQTISLAFSGIPLHLSGDELVEGYLYQTSTYCKGVDFVGMKRNVFGSTGQDGEYLIAFQATAQKTSMTSKFQATINIPEKFTKNKIGVLLIMMSLYFPSFDNNYATFIQVTNSSSPTIQKKYENWWFGQLVDSEPLEALYISIQKCMQVIV